MIDVCYSKQDLVYSRVASRLETAQLRKNIERHLHIKVNKASFKKFVANCLRKVFGVKIQSLLTQKPKKFYLKN